MLSSEATVCVYGKVSAVPEGKQAPRNVELSADYWEVVGHSPAGGAESVLNDVQNIFSIYRKCFIGNLLFSKFNRKLTRMFNWITDT